MEATAAESALINRRKGERPAVFARVFHCRATGCFEGISRIDIRSTPLNYKG